MSSKLAPIPTDSALRVLIVDDEPLAREGIRLCLELRSDVEVLAECEQGQDAVRLIAALDPDLVFLDVQMPGLDGFEVVERIGPRDMPAVVFVTGHDVHALRAFQVHALDFVLKPFDDARLHEAVDRARDQIRMRQQGEVALRLAALLAELHPTASTARANEPRIKHIKRLTLRDQERALFLPIGDVDSFEADGNYVRVFANGQAHRIRATLTGLSARLDAEQFVRIHRSTIVNVERIREIQPWFGSDYVAIMTDGRQLRVSRTYALDLLRPIR